jgi:hypothetical protein
MLTNTKRRKFPTAEDNVNQTSPHMHRPVHRIPGHDVDRIDITAGLRELTACGYNEPETNMVIEYALARWARGEEEAAQRGAIDREFHGINLTSWTWVLAAAMAHADDAHKKSSQGQPHRRAEAVHKTAPSQGQVPRRANAAPKKSSRGQATGASGPSTRRAARLAAVPPADRHDDGGRRLTTGVRRDRAGSRPRTQNSSRTSGRK